MLGLYEIASGRLVSVGSVMPDPLPEGFAVSALPAGGRYGVTHTWDAVGAAWVPVASGVGEMSPADFMRRLGFARESYLNAVRRNPATPPEIAGQLDTLAAWLGRVSKVEFADPITQLGVGFMASVLNGGGQLPEGPDAFRAAMLAPVGAL